MVSLHPVASQGSCFSPASPASNSPLQEQADQHPDTLYHLPSLKNPNHPLPHLPNPFACTPLSSLHPTSLVPFMPKLLKRDPNVLWNGTPLANQHILTVIFSNCSAASAFWNSAFQLLQHHSHLVCSYLISASFSLFCWPLLLSLTHAPGSFLDPLLFSFYTLSSLGDLRQSPGGTDDP